MDSFDNTDRSFPSAEARLLQVTSSKKSPTSTPDECRTMLAPLLQSHHLNAERSSHYRVPETDSSHGAGYSAISRNSTTDKRSSFMINDILADKVLPVMSPPDGGNRTAAAAAAALFATNCFRSAVEASFAAQSFNRTGSKMDASRENDMLLVDDFRRFPSPGNSVMIGGRDDVTSSWVSPPGGVGASGSDLSCKSAAYCDSDVDIDDDNDVDSSSSIGGKWYDVYISRFNLRFVHVHFSRLLSIFD